jgi:hypothetical protein
MTIKFSDEVKSILKLTRMSDAQIQTAEVRANQASKRLEIVDAKRRGGRAVGYGEGQRGPWLYFPEPS